MERPRAPLPFSRPAVRFSGWNTVIDRTTSPATRDTGIGIRPQIDRLHIGFLHSLREIVAGQGRDFCVGTMVTLRRSWGEMPFLGEKTMGNEPLDAAGDRHL
ncbi:MAG: hypothetical protein FD153_416 [Rhodospirillaceae bacterium]|nr:MAG: hypothetical protein FD153_416 [Rhodospirillaceae bacterium]